MNKDEITNLLKDLKDIELAVLSNISFYSSNSKGSIVKRLNEINFRVSPTRQLYPKDIEPVLDKFVQLGAVKQHNLTFQYWINSEVKPYLVWQLKDSKVLQAYSTILKPGAYNYYRNSSDDIECKIIVSILLGSEESFFTLSNNHYPKAAEIFIYLFEKPFKKQRLNDLPESIRSYILKSLYNNAINLSKCLNPYIDYLEETPCKEQKAMLAALYTNKGDMEKLKQLEFDDRSSAICNLFQGNYDLSIQYFEKSVLDYRKAVGKKKGYPTDFSALFYLIALFIQNNDKSNLIFNELLAEALKQKQGIKTAFHMLQIVRSFRQNNIALAKDLLDKSGDIKYFAWDDLLVWVLVKQWFDKFSKEEINFLLISLEQSIENEYWILSINLYDVLNELKAIKTDNFANRINAIRKKTGILGMSNLVEQEEEWERALKAFTMLAVNNSSKHVNDKRLAWLVDFEKKYVQPKEQSIDKRGLWSEGQNVALKRLKDADLECMTTQDIKIASNIYKESYGYYGGEQYYINTEKSFKEMVGHPLLFHYDKPAIGVELVKAYPEIIIAKNGNKYELSFNEDFESEGIKIIKETPTRFKLLEISSELLTIKKSFGKKSLIVPEKGREKLQDAIKSLSSYVTVHSDLAQNADIPSIKANSDTHIHLLPIGDGFKIEFFVKPFTSTPPYFKPGAGGKVLYTMLNGTKHQATRDLKKEEKLALEFIEACPSLLGLEDIKSSWVFNEPDECLQFLTELEEYKGNVVVEWPEGEKIRIKHRFSFKNLNLNIKSTGTGWFDVSGSLKVSEKQVMEMKDLLSLIEIHNTNFIPLGNGDFIALTSEFRRRLEEMSAFSSQSKGEFKFNSISAFALNNLFDDFDIKADKQWKDTIKNIQASLNLQPKVPLSMDVELRPYQIDGYNWLFRLSHWGVGACLADDMGLGKTIQSIALLIERAANGPALVVAPASVCNNWVKEILRFAPTLNPVFYAEQRDILKNINPSLVVVCTYGLLQSNIEEFTSTHWHSVILDEAQAIKNNTTKRSQSVMELNADFRLITTGTPIQNHLGELWSLFNFINPGLLGSLKMFNDKFAIPIEKNQDKLKRNQLRRLIQPFILRRTKNQVLDELPEKTEITINVELSMEEMAFYEALRQKAVEKIESVEGNIEQKRIQILAEITKLRRACCNPLLVTPDIQLESSKLSAFEEIVDELLDNKHRALVFSQFLGHLDIVRKLLDKKGITYQYLDGSTTLKDRETSITAFQAGSGDLFLISLKAGGLGLNLTAADYVIHLDPWWNPAIEDQASDRAHRIGQLRPVTIYKLITQNTIEEKIIMLHKNKRDLADSLLDGTDISGKISADDLLKLIKN